MHVHIYIDDTAHPLLFRENGCVRQTQLLLDDLEEYINSSERLQIHSATVESAERNLSRKSEADVLSQFLEIEGFDCAILLKKSRISERNFLNIKRGFLH